MTSPGYTTCCECGQPVPPDEEWTQPVEGGAGIARGHRQCIEAEWGPAPRVVDLMAALEASLDDAKRAQAERAERSVQ